MNVVCVRANHLNLSSNADNLILLYVQKLVRLIDILMKMLFYSY